ncbi:MAG: N-acetyl-gamma-glutamyl-phosphate reductase [Candidatus Kapaibacterium sp.]
MHIIKVVPSMQSAKEKITVSILGASGYSGAMALRILLRHPGVTVDKVFGTTSVGEKVHSIYPSLRGLTDKTYEEYSLGKTQDSGIVFLALPAGHAMKVVPEIIQSGKKVIDLSGDFRLKDSRLYKVFYKEDHSSQNLLDSACYGMPEISRNVISGSQLLSNPGCYPTSVIIPLAPLLKNGLIEPDDISISSLSGVSGAGRKSTVDLSFAEVDGSVKAYRVGDHQHIPEIESVLSAYSGQNVSVNFVPHLLPAVRGIYSTMFVTPKGNIAESQIEEAYQDAFASEPFVRYLGNEIPELKNVVGSNFIDIGWKFDERNGKLIVFSAIDNLIKGAAGQAIQNMNIMCGFDEKEALIV